MGSAPRVVVLAGAATRCVCVSYAFGAEDPIQLNRLACQAVRRVLAMLSLSGVMWNGPASGMAGA